MDSDKQAEFIETWGAMGALWGINRSMARIHALLITQEAPLSLDEISERLQISRGNASMSLKDLRAWGVIQRVHINGERKDFYVTAPDMWEMFFAILRERKRREFDPALSAVREALAEASGGGEVVEARLKQMLELLQTGERAINRLLAHEGASKAFLGLLAGF
ncbi:HTH domain-containing protein [Myxococcota bacterium]|nr:HTH domain-containing protein [Myxococcota bacterium]MBU1429633.1 HTH domain-containing protein [Myxococcota bacterium]MBU1899722.1 HTH domain-containing protein [Myxococcota bacterium]